MRPPNLRGHSRKLSDLFTDRKIPRALRKVAQVLLDPETGEIVWAEHIGPALGTNHAVTLTNPEVEANNDECSREGKPSAI